MTAEILQNAICACGSGEESDNSVTSLFWHSSRKPKLSVCFLLTDLDNIYIFNNIFSYGPSVVQDVPPACDAGLSRTQSLVKPCGSSLWRAAEQHFPAFSLPSTATSSWPCVGGSIYLPCFPLQSLQVMGMVASQCCKKQSCRKGSWIFGLKKGGAVCWWVPDEEHCSWTLPLGPHTGNGDFPFPETAFLLVGVPSESHCLSQ